MFGTVSAIDEKTCRVRVRIGSLDNLRTAMLPVLQQKTLKDKHYCLPDIGEHVAVLLDPNGEDGVVLGAIFSDADMPPVASGDKFHRVFSDGAEFEYDRASHALNVKGGIVTINVDAVATVTVKAGEKVTVDAPETTFTGNVLVEGSITYIQGLTGYGGGGGGASAMIYGTVQTTVDVIASNISLVGHKHGGVQSGGSQTGQPVG
ncbi:MAG: phage baseplate assembly protein V [Proteobacteria bacterium]|nr:phage baseplate assembly protein V [Pseudomonadota bacterium]